MNVHNELSSLAYSLNNGSILELQSGLRYVICKYDDATRIELFETSNRTQYLALTGMMAIRKELTPTCICQLFPADLPSTWYIVFFRTADRQIDSFANPVSGRNVAVVLERFRKQGLGESLEGAFWYSKPSEGYFTKNPHQTDDVGVPSLTEFLADEQTGYRPYTNGRTRVGTSPMVQWTGVQTYASRIPEGQTFTFIPGNSPTEITWSEPEPFRVWGSEGYTPPSPKIQKKLPAPKPNKLGRQIDLEDE